MAEKLALAPIMISVLGVAQYSDWLVLYACGVLLATIDFGLAPALGNYVQRALLDNPESGQQAIGLVGASALGFLAVALGVIFLLYYLGGNEGLSLWVVAALGLESLGPEQAFHVAALLFSAHIVNNSILVTLQVYRGYREFHRKLHLMAAVVGTRGFVTIGAVLATQNLLVAAAAYFVAHLAIMGFCVIDVRRRYGASIIRLAMEIPPLPTGLIGEGGMFWLRSVSFKAVQQLPMPMLSSIGVGSGDIVAFQLLKIIATFIRSIARRVSHVLGVEWTELSAQKSYIVEKAMFVDAVRWAAGVGAVVSVSAAACAPQVVLVWTSGRVEIGYALGAVLMAGALVSASCQPAIAMFQFTGEARKVAAAGAIQLAVLAAMGVALTRYFGAIGMAFAILLAELVGNSWFLLREGFEKVRADNKEIAGILIRSASGFLIASLLWIIGLMLIGNALGPLATLILFTGASVAVVVGCTYLIVMQPDERGLFRERMRKVLKGI